MKNLSINPIYIIVIILALVAFKTPSSFNYNNSSERIITVTGSADMVVPPDEILVDISYREYWFNHHLKTKKSIKKIERDIKFIERVARAYYRVRVGRNIKFGDSDRKWRR